MPPNCPWTAQSRAAIVSRCGRALAEPNARPVCALRVNFCRLGPPQQMASASCTGQFARIRARRSNAGRVKSAPHASNGRSRREAGHCGSRSGGEAALVDPHLATRAAPPGGAHSSGRPALRRPSNTAGRFGVWSFIHLIVIAGLRRRASATCGPNGEPPLQEGVGGDFKQHPLRKGSATVPLRGIVRAVDQNKRRSCPVFYRPPLSLSLSPKVAIRAPTSIGTDRPRTTSPAISSGEGFRNRWCIGVLPCAPPSC